MTKRLDRMGLRQCSLFIDCFFDEGAFQKYGITETIPYHLTLTKEIVENFHARSVRVYFWTEDGSEEMLGQRRLGGDSLLIDRIGIMDQTLGAVR